MGDPMIHILSRKCTYIHMHIRTYIDAYIHIGKREKETLASSVSCIHTHTHTNKHTSQTNTFINTCTQGNASGRACVFVAKPQESRRQNHSQQARPRLSMGYPDFLSLLHTTKRLLVPESRRHHRSCVASFKRKMAQRPCRHFTEEMMKCHVMEAWSCETITCICICVYVYIYMFVCVYIYIYIMGASMFLYSLSFCIFHHMHKDSTSLSKSYEHTHAHAHAHG